VREAQKIERLRLRDPKELSVSGGEPSELDQPRLLRMQLQPELREPVAKIGKEPLGVVTMLEARHVVVGEPREDHVPRAFRRRHWSAHRSKNVMQVDV
jgi:hypothetical protein